MVHQIQHLDTGVTGTAGTIADLNLVGGLRISQITESAGWLLLVVVAAIQINLK
jgi:hypothetical protein